MANRTDTEGAASSYGAMERFMIWFLIPFVFTAVLLGVLLTMFDYDVKGSILRTLDKIPVVERLIPESAVADHSNKDSGINSLGANQTAESEPSAEEQLMNQSAELSAKERQLKLMEEQVEQQKQAVSALQAENEKLKQQQQEQAVSRDEYTAKVQQLAGIYAKMSPSKAAPVIQNLTINERVLVLSMMKTDEQVKILEKMNPQIAADTSILLKDQSKAEDTQLAALQERLERLTSSPVEAGTALTDAELGATFAAMAPQSASEVLLEMQSKNQQAVVSILKAMDSTSRSKIISAIAAESKETAALISARLAQ